MAARRHEGMPEVPCRSVRRADGRLKCRRLTENGSHHPEIREETAVGGGFAVEGEGIGA